LGGRDVVCVWGEEREKRKRKKKKKEKEKKGKGKKIKKFVNASVFILMSARVQNR
jgi:hypothetical protein